MKVLIQRVKFAKVEVDRKVVGQINKGILALVGIDRQDSTDTVEKLAEKTLSYRIFSDNEGKMNLNVKEIEGGVLAVSQFTLSANTQKGLRPSFSSAAPPEYANELFAHFVNTLKTRHHIVEQGMFGADMQVSLQNDGPVTFLLES